MRAFEALLGIFLFVVELSDEEPSDKLVLEADDELSDEESESSSSTAFFEESGTLFGLNSSISSEEVVDKMSICTILSNVLRIGGKLQ
jgi:hypothetical protein